MVNVTRRTGDVTFFRRTRNALWTKGETSGNKLAVKDVLIASGSVVVAILVFSAIFYLLNTFFNPFSSGH